MVSDDRRQRFEAVFRGHHDQVLRYARRRLPEPADAQDALAETFTVAWRRLHEVPDDALPWLLGTARRVIANHRRAAGRRERLHLRLGHEARAGDAASADRGEPEPGRLAVALARLAEPDREALLLVAWEGLDRRAAARAMGCSPAAFATRLHRARRRLERLLREPAPAPLPDRPPNAREST